ncbi:MAG: DUF3808 domain-containing protein [Desulfamplus sp.]|nr:DUF3808 domain-containing protein [Desulfamplus sp.]
MKIATMNTFILSIIDSIREQCFISTFKDNRYAKNFEPSINQEPISHKKFDNTNQHDSIKSAQSELLRWPDFIGLGVAKSGTTWVHSMLNQHKSICFPRANRNNPFCYGTSEQIRLQKEESFDFKEVQFWNPFYYPFHRKKKFYQEYKKLFSHVKDGQSVGEIANNYLLFLLLEQEIMSEFYSNMPDVKLFICLRNPVDRYISHHFFQWDMMNIVKDLGITNGYAEGGFPPLKDDIKNIIAWLDADKPISSNMPLYIRAFVMGLYPLGIKNILSKYDTKQLHIIFFDDIKEKPASVLKELCLFLEIDPDFEFKEIEKPVNVTKTLKPDVVEEKQLLYELYKPSIVELSNLLDKDLSHWLLDHNLNLSTKKDKSIGEISHSFVKQINTISIPELYIKATHFYNVNNFDEAEQICNKILDSVPHGDTYNLLAHIADSKGEYEKSIELMQKAIELYKTSSRYHNNLGNLFFNQGRLSEAADAFRKAIKFKPNYFEALFNLGLASTNIGNYEEALDAFKKVIKIRPDYSDACTNIGNIYMVYKKESDAIEMYRRALKSKPNDPIASINLAIALKSLDKTDEAIEILEKSLKKFPNEPEILLNLGNIYHAKEEMDKAIKFFEALVAINPNHEKGLYNLGTTFMNMGQYAKSISYLERVLKLSPNDLHGLNNMGLVHFNIGDFKNALNFFEKAIELYPNFPKTYNNIALVYKRLEQKTNAMENFQYAIDRDPEFAEAYHNLAEMQRESSMLEDASINAKKAIELQPDLTPANTHYSYVLKWLCEWEEYDRLKVHIDKLVREEIDKGQSPGESPFMNIIREDDPSYNLKVANFFAHNFTETAKNLNIKFAFDERLKEAKNSKTRKITIGYLSSNFRNHPMAHLLCDLFKSHNREQFQVNCYSIGHDDKSEYRKRFMQDADVFRDIRYVGYAESAQLIFDDGVDILIDLMGYTHGSRLEISALRPAPIQVRYMGMPGTTGGNLFDYIIVDEIVLPRDQQIHYAEKFIYMPYTYQINDRSKKISDEPVTRDMFNLPEDSFIFCSFNTSYKIDPIIFEAWMEILHKTENSVLWLMPDNERAGENMLKVAKEKHGISPDRIIYTKSIPIPEHLARIGLADLALDTRAVGGAATTSDALWGGVPVITLLGSRFVSRMSASILSAIGLDELITDNIEQYKELAIHFAKNRDSLKELKLKLRQNIETMPLFDTEGFTRHLERGFRRIWDIYVAGEKPQIVDLKEDIRSSYDNS